MRVFRGVPSHPSRYTAARLACVLGLLVILPACATKPPPTDPVALAQYKKADDPYEPVNRKIYKFNKGVDKYVLNPMSSVYTTIFPGIVRDRFRSFFDNLNEPVIFINDVLQGQGKRATDSLGRFVLNSSVGIGGLFDPAAKIGIPFHTEDFGQTLAVYGVKDGGYLVIPIYGPSSTRDSFGLVVDIAMDPIGWALRLNNLGYLSWPRVGGSALDKYTRMKDLLNDVQKNSVDGYAALRSYYRQNRAFEIRNGKPASKQEQQQQNDLFDQFENDSSQ